MPPGTGSLKCFHDHVCRTCGKDKDETQVQNSLDAACTTRGPGDALQLAGLRPSLSWSSASASRQADGPAPNGDELQVGGHGGEGRAPRVRDSS